MSFPLNSEPKKISFVGRALDPNKGFTTLLDALELLLNLPKSPRFDFWVIGGEPDEAEQLSRLFEARPHLNKLLSEGRITVWGRVKRSALPEFYKRSLLVVMPSHREPFGLVAIESMLCGCPVIGTKQGGLSDTIVHGMTGVQADVDSPQALANAMLLYLRSPTIRKTRGIFARDWACFAFSKTTAYGQVQQLYRGTLPVQSKKTEWDLAEKYVENNIIRSIEEAQNILGCQIDAHKVIISRYHTLIRLECSKGSFALKQFKERPSLREAVFPIGKLTTSFSVENYVDNARFHEKCPYSPAIVEADKNLGFVIYEWLSEAEPVASGEKIILDIIDKIAEFGRNKIPQIDLEEYNKSVADFLLNPSVDSLNFVDKKSIQLNSHSFGYDASVRETHPVVELHRVLFCLEHKGWILGKDIDHRLRMIIELVLNLSSDAFSPIELCHGDLKGRHIVRSGNQFYTLDTERAIFAVGALDLGVWSCSQIIHGRSSFEIVKLLKKLSRSESEITTALQWLVYSLAFGYLVRLQHGEVEGPTKRIQRIIYSTLSS